MPMQENRSYRLPQMSYKHWCWKNELHLNIGENFDHQMSLSKSKRWYSNIVHISKYKDSVFVTVLCFQHSPMFAS